MNLNPPSWSEMTLNYSMMVERYPNLKEDIGGSIPDCEISSPLDKFVALTYQPFVSLKKKEKNRKKTPELKHMSKVTNSLSQILFNLGLITKLRLEKPAFFFLFKSVWRLNTGSWNPVWATYRNLQVQERLGRRCLQRMPSST